MGNCSGPAVNKDDLQKSKEIDDQLRKEKKTIDHEVKLLLLGAGESGKSTIAKQMKIIFLTGFTDEEKAPYKEIVHSNVILAMRSLILCFQKGGLLEQLSDSNQKNAQLFMSNTILFEQEVTPEIGRAVKELWADQFLKKTYINTSDFQVNDSASYYFDSVDRIADENYLPTQQDILRSRARTTGITEISYDVQDVRFRMVDVGGQRSERKKMDSLFSRSNCFDLLCSYE